MSLSPTNRDRLVSLALGVPCWVVLGLAAWLTPSPQGYGTHHQLGLGQCTLLSLTGWPCPMCGMTTCFAHMAHLQPFAALETQPFGVVLFLITLATALSALVELVNPRHRWIAVQRWIEERELPIAIGLLLGLAAGWIYKILIMKVLVTG